MTLPAFAAAGNLPPGTHPAPWAEMVARFGGRATDPDGGVQRQTLLAGLRRALDLLAAVGCRRVWLGGSFVTDIGRAAAEVPGDVDVCWDATEMDLAQLASAALDLHPLHGDCDACRNRFGGGYFAVTEPLALGMLADFRRDRSGRTVGVVLLELPPEEGAS